MRENEYQARLKERISKMFPGCIIAKLDPNDIQGIPDLLILYGDAWAVLEVKKSRADANHPRPNQKYYVHLLNEMSFSRFIFPENEEDVLYELQQTFNARGKSRAF